MKVVILAAGRGVRFDEEAEKPKCLITLANRQTILERQLAFIAQYTSLTNVIIVVGHLKEMIMQTYPSLTYVHNPLYLEENTAKSLLRGLQEVNDDILWLNGDVVFRKDVLDALLKDPKTSMVVNQGPVSDEEVKYRSSSQGWLTEVSKTVKIGEGEALGINFCKKEDLPLLKKNLELCQPKDYFEKAIEKSIGEGLKIYPAIVDAISCAEIDFPEDLERVNSLLQKW